MLFQILCTTGVMCSFTVSLAFAPMDDETVTVVVKPEPGGQERVRFIDTTTFVPVDDLGSDNYSRHLLTTDVVRACSVCVQCVRACVHVCVCNLQPRRRAKDAENKCQQLTDLGHRKEQSK